ncbi:MAG: undecaprenyl-diphosphatase UppP [Desulfobacteraceae bacterium]|nr:undecaprenyl-diphosphatase UppP [Desulfobacteraceae bacterium]
MSIAEAILLGIIQGLTEFLPISSTAHLTIAGQYLGLIDPARPEQWTAFIAVIQLGTMLAVLLFFFRDVIEITVSFIGETLVSRTPFRLQSLESRLGWCVILGSIPIAFIGLALKKIIEGHLTKSMVVIGTSLVVMAILLAVAELTGRFSKDLKKLSRFDSVLIGCAQALALIPGASRSGTTITAGLFLGLTRESAARFSFLLSIPAVFASGLLEFKESLAYMGSQDLMILVVATVSSAISGYATIALLLRFLRTHTTYVFVLYRILLGAFLLFFV